VSWDPKVEDKLRRLLVQCQDPEAAVKWGPHLIKLCEEISERGAKSWKKGRTGALLLLMEAGPHFARKGQVRDFMHLLEPLLVNPSKQLLDDVFACMIEPILIDGGFGSIVPTLEVLRDYARDHDDSKHWVAWVKTVAGTINALYTMNRLATADGYHKFFEDVPLKFKTMTRFFESQAMLDMAVWHARAANTDRCINAVTELKYLMEYQSSQASRRNYAAGLVALSAMRVADEDLDALLEEEELLWAIVSKFPEDVELASEYLHFLAEALPAALAAREAEGMLKRWCELHVIFRKSAALGEKASELVLALAEEHPGLVAEHGAALEAPLHQLEKRFARGNPMLAERCRQVREKAGLPPRAAGCLGVVLAVVAVALAA
jgi:hypothetical protein